MNEERKRIFEAKEEFHIEQAKLPFAEKIRALVKMQELAKTVDRYKTNSSPPAGHLKP